MLAVAGAALWLGGWFWVALVALVGLGAFFEWSKLVVGFVHGTFSRWLWFAAGLLYLGLACFTLTHLRVDFDMLVPPPPNTAQFDGKPQYVLNPGWDALQGVLSVVLTVIAVDVGAYFAGRTIGGPKIAPRISPSKTWAGLGGGILVSWLTLLALNWIAVSRVAHYYPGTYEIGIREVFANLAGGIIVAVVAQSGDFFESWMKRRAGVKDSGRLLPGHGGLFDRTDGLIAVSFVVGLLGLIGG
jgi:phosphatidate cytidylyltransferase